MLGQRTESLLFYFIFFFLGGKREDYMNRCEEMLNHLKSFFLMILKKVRQKGKKDQSNFPKVFQHKVDL